MSKALIQDRSFKSNKSKIETLFILCNEECSEKLQEVGQNTMREKAKTWVGLVTFGTVSEAVNWRNGPELQFFDNNWKLKLNNTRLS